MTEKLFIVQVIECVEKHPCLWDHSSILYAKREELEKAWQQISEECGKPVSFCRDKWKNVRTGFLRSLREYPENTQYKKKPFYLYENMKFLLPTILHNDSSTPSPAVRNSDLSNNCAIEIQDNSESEIVKVEDSSSESDILSYEELDKFENIDIVAKRGYFSQFGPSSSNKSEFSPKQSETDEPPNKKHTITNDNDQVRETKEELALMSFFKGITSDVLSLSIKNQRFFKRKIVELVDDLHKDDQTIQEFPKQQCTNIYYTN